MTPPPPSAGVSELFLRKLWQNIPPPPADFLRKVRHANIAGRRSAIDEVKTLRGIITICAACKKIRTDVQSWDQMEAYVQAHSEAKFSHALCPDCIRRLYPEDAEWITEQMNTHRPHVQDASETGSNSSVHQD